MNHSELYAPLFVVLSQQRLWHLFAIAEYFKSLDTSIFFLFRLFWNHFLIVVHLAVNWLRLFVDFFRIIERLFETGVYNSNLMAEHNNFQYWRVILYLFLLNQRCFSNKQTSIKHWIMGFAGHIWPEGLMLYMSGLKCAFNISRELRRSTICKMCGNYCLHTFPTMTMMVFAFCCQIFFVAISRYGTGAR